MRTKSAYRDRVEERPEEIPASEKIKNIDPDATVLRHEGDQPPNEAVVEALGKAAQSDDAAHALKAQIEALRRSEEMHRQHATMAAAQQPRLPVGREERLALWRANGLSEGDAAFLRENGDLIDWPDITRVASAQAAQEGHALNTDQHREATLRIFHELMSQAANAAAPAPTETPQFFRPPPPPTPPSRASIVSAPVSRGGPDAGAYHERPTSVRLNAEEREAAKMAGISEVEYAKNKLKMLRMQHSGELQK